jgi:hypothetical protein
MGGRWSAGGGEGEWGGGATHGVKESVGARMEKRMRIDEARQERGATHTDTHRRGPRDLSPPPQAHTDEDRRAA